MEACYGLTQFEWDDERDLASHPVWVCYPQFVPIRNPLYVWSISETIPHGTQLACETLCVPTTKGYDHRLVNGYAYLSTTVITDAEEIKQRETTFREKMAPFIDDFDKEWGKYVAEMLAIYKPLQEIQKAGLERLSDIELLLHFEQCLQMNRRQWDVHFIVFYVIYSLYVLFEQTCQQLTGIGPQDTRFKNLMGGFDNMLFTVNKEIWRLGDRAQELGLADLFLGREDDEGVMRALEASQAGEKWLEEYRAFLKVHGWRCPNMLDWSSPSWIERPSLGIATIRQGLAGGGAFALEEERARLAKIREKAEREVLSKVPREQKEWFEKLMKVAQKCGVWSEEHNYYLDMPANALCRHVCKEYGRRFARAGVIEQPEDIYFVFPWEIAKAAVMMERVSLRRYVKRYKGEFERYSKMEPQFILGDPGKLGWMAANDPLIRVQMTPQLIKEELKADLYGAGAAPGVVEGVARVVMTEWQLGEVQPGEILVAPVTSAPWTPVFGIIGGVVTDLGGALIHAAIVGREYGIPAVVGTLQATKKIRTGDRIRVDGDNAAVYILEKKI